MSGWRMRLSGLTTMVLLLLAVPSVASAADRFVDAETGADTDPACTSAAPCASISYAVANASQAETIYVDNGTYNEAVTLGQGLALEFMDFVPGDGSLRPTIDGGAGTAVTVAASGADVIRGFRLSGDSTGVTLNGPALIDDGVFDEPDSNTATGVFAGFGSAGSAIHDSSFSDPAPSASRDRVGVVLSERGEVRDSTFTGLNAGIIAGTPSGGDTLLVGNEITQIHHLPSQGRGIAAQSQPGFGKVILRENLIADAVGSIVYGVVVFDGNVSFERNEISGQTIGAFLTGNTPGVTLEGDRIWGNEISGLELSDNGVAPPRTSATATNVTVMDSGGSIRVENADLTLDSSIADVMLPSGSGACTVTHSIGPPEPGPPSPPDTSGCFDFVSNADPLLADVDAGDLHLQPGSPAIDLGNPDDPGVEAVDFDGDPRAVDGATDCDITDRRDVGADEYVPPAPIDCTPPETSIDSGPADGAFMNDPTPTFGFSSEVGATFECSINGAPFGACSHANQQILDLASAPDGPHSFAVRATDSSGNTDPTPAQRSFTLDRQAPAVTFTKTPKKKTKSKKAAFRFIADEPAEYGCWLDSKLIFACPGRASLKVSPGRHRFNVVATDAAGNIGTASSYRFKRVKKKRK